MTARREPFPWLAVGWRVGALGVVVWHDHVAPFGEEWLWVVGLCLVALAVNAAWLVLVAARWAWRRLRS